MELSYVMGFGLGTTLALLALLRIGQRIFSPAHTVARDLTESNAARRLLTVGQVLAVFLVAANAVKNCLDGSGFARDLLWVSAFAVVGLLLVIATGQLGIRLLLKARLPAEIERGNAAAGLAAGAHYVATGLITSRAIAGKDLGDLAISLGFFLLAQITLHVFISLFRALTTYDDAEQIQGENLAAALSYAGASIAVAIIIARALEGDFEGLFVSLKGYGGVLLYLFALYPVRQLLVQSLLLGAPLALRGGRLDAGIAAERNEGMGALEAATYLATSIAVARLL